jgi:5-methylcytosine-specific restriction enzyme subunit McrC
MSNSQTPQNPISFTEYGIPIRNLWHMLLYAWNEAPLNAMHSWMMEDAEQAPTLDALLASILIRLMQQRLRIGLGHDYVDEERKFPGVRGRINFAESLKQRTLESGQLICDFQGFSINASKNQIIRSTLARLLKVGQFGPFDTATPLRATPEAAAVKDVQQKLRRLIRDLDGIDFIELTPDLIRRQLLARSGGDHDYRLMLSICDLIVQRQMPSGSEGTSFAVPAFDREALVLHNIYERFVANFYRIHLTGWSVSAQKRLEWHAKEASEQLPVMVPDLVLQEESSDQIIILDTKFTAHSLIENQWGKPIFDSAHLYQLYAYLKSQEQLSEAHHHAIGMLLYPAVQSKLSEKIELQDHIIRIESIDLAAPWQEIERQLTELIKTP